MAHRLALRIFPRPPEESARFTRAQLFACLVLREFYGLSYRRAERLLADSPQWLADIGLSVAPDHNTLWRAGGSVVARRRVERMLDLLAGSSARLLRLARKPLALDSTCFEGHHRSGHYDRRCRQMDGGGGGGGGGTKVANRPGKWGDSVNAARRRRLSSMPKLALAVASGCHLILATRTHIGNGSDAPDFDELLFKSWKRAPVKVVVADAGYDSEGNHRIARMDTGVRSIIPPGIGRPTDKPPTGRWRRHMAKRFKRKADAGPYGQRNQSETVHSMIKRNQSSALRARTPERREKEMLLRALTHNIALLCEQDIKL